MSPAMDLNETVKVDPNNITDNKHTDVEIVTKKKKNNAKKQIMKIPKIYELTISASDPQNKLWRSKGWVV